MPRKHTLSRALIISPSNARAARQEANLALMGMRPEADAQLDTSRVLDAVCGELRSEAEPTRLEAITWVKFLLDRHPAATLDRLGVLLPALLDALSAPSLRVVLQALAVLAAVADKPRLFRRVLTDLLDRCGALVTTKSDDEMDV